jgi:glycosyltransferase involved in cell wall biosynthesis
MTSAHMTRVTFIVPTRNAERTIRACLESIRRQHHDDVELVVVDNASTDRTFAIAREIADVVALYGPERSAQRNHGATLATGWVLVFADADMVFEPTVAGDVLGLLGRDGDPAVGAVVIPELAFGAGFWARCRVLEKELYLGDPAVEAARGVRADDFARAGGYDEALVGPEDWELADRVVAMGDRHLARTSGRVWHDEGRIELRAAYRKKRYYGRGVASYLRNPRRRPLRRRALTEPLRVARRPDLAAGLAVLKFVELSGIATGVVESRVRRTSP